MYLTEIEVNLFELVSRLAHVTDLMSPVVGNHHMRVAYLALRIAEELGLPPDERHDIVLAGTVHDIGCFSLQERKDLLDFEFMHTAQHEERGYQLLRTFAPFETVATMVRHHHTPWRGGEGAMRDGVQVPRGAHILNLADRVAVLLDTSQPVLGQTDGIRKRVERARDVLFVPEYADALLALLPRDYVWLEAVSDWIDDLLRDAVGRKSANVNLDRLAEFSRLVCRIIDFKSPFTACHSSGVAAVAEDFAGRIGFSEQECLLMEVAGNFHDLGKLAVPSEILEKRDRLTEEEWQVMRTHVYYTHEVLRPLPELRTIALWGTLHQERLNGSGYPFGRVEGQLPLGSRIMAIADVFVALTEDRPYRAGMPKTAVMAELLAMAARNELDPVLVGKVGANFEEMDEIRKRAQQRARDRYSAFRTCLQ